MTKVGVTIAVPDPWGAQLKAYRAALGDVTAASIPTHITLMPPFEVDPDLVPTVERHLADAAARTSPFQAHLRGTGTFRPVSPVVFVVVAQGISQCAQLASAVRRGPLSTDFEFPYHPHVTVAHHLADKLLDQAVIDLQGFECEFSVDHFSLYVHDTGTGWQQARTFMLTARPHP